MYHVFVNNKPIVLSDTKPQNATYAFYLYKEIQLQEVFYKLRNTDIKGMYLFHEDLDYMWQDFCNHFEIVEAAGGLVLREEALLLIYRNHFWDLPKGKKEEGESIAETAIREVSEECGIRHLQIQEHLKKTYHIYFEDNHFKMKMTHWYTMLTRDNAQPAPQQEEGIRIAEFINLNQLNEKYDNMYANIHHVITYFLKHKHKDNHEDRIDKRT